MLESKLWKNKIVTKLCGKMAVLVKAFDHYHNKFQLFQLSCETVKEFETETYIEI